jgi:poly(glycerol-phosphate) alpha-glucosyltransferase
MPDDSGSRAGPRARVPAVRLPSGRHFVLTWSIPRDYGGMTSALLHRSRAFVRLGGQPLDVLTFDPLLDAPATEAALRDRGELVPGMRLRNVWDWLGEREDGAAWSDGISADPPAALPGDGRRRVRYADDGVTVQQLDFVRPDGTRFASDRRDSGGQGVPTRRILLFDDAGRPVRAVTRVRTLYEEWLDQLTGGQHAFLIADSKPMAGFLLAYRRPNVTTVHVVHGSHLAAGSRSELHPTRERVFRELRSLDRVILLTERQRRDVERLLGPKRNLAVIPNGRELPGRHFAEGARSLGHGVVLSALTARKRVDHAADAVALARLHGADQVRLDVYGDGPAREELAASLADRAGFVTLRGHDPDARRLLPLASYLLLTSTSEGFPLVLVEAMAAGCLPIAYDVRYGPADVIRNGRNGFLVPDGDVPALAAAILELQRMPAARVARMRAAARRTAERFSDAAVTRRWSEELALAAAAHREAFGARVRPPDAALLDVPGGVPISW